MIAPFRTIPLVFLCVSVPLCFKPYLDWCSCGELL